MESSSFKLLKFWTNSLKVLLSRSGLVNVVDWTVVGPVRAVGTVPAVVAVDPGQVAGERGEEVKQRPGDDDVIVEANVEGNEDHCEADACQDKHRWISVDSKDGDMEVIALGKSAPDIWKGHFRGISTNPEPNSFLPYRRRLRTEDATPCTDHWTLWGKLLFVNMGNMNPIWFDSSVLVMEDFHGCKNSSVVKVKYIYSSTVLL